MALASTSPAPPADALEVRARIVDALRLDLVGPWDGHALAAEQLPTRARPSNWYMAGFLIPTDTPPDRRGDDDLDTVPDRSGLVEESNDERKAARKAFYPAEPSWFPAVENRGEGVFLRLRTEAVDDWLGRAAVKRRLDALERGHARWAERRKSASGFPGGPYVLLHTLSHLRIQSLAMQCGYPASSLRERVYAEDGRYGLLVYTGSPDAEGTLGGLVQQARRMDETSALKVTLLLNVQRTSPR